MSRRERRDLCRTTPERATEALNQILSADHTSSGRSGEALLSSDNHSHPVLGSPFCYQPLRSPSRSRATAFSFTYPYPEGSERPGALSRSPGLGVASSALGFPFQPIRGRALSPPGSCTGLPSTTLCPTRRSHSPQDFRPTYRYQAQAYTRQLSSPRDRILGPPFGSLPPLDSLQDSQRSPSLLYVRSAEGRRGRAYDQPSNEDLLAATRSAAAFGARRPEQHPRCQSWGATSAGAVHGRSSDLAT